MSLLNTCNAFSNSSCVSASFLKPIVLAVIRMQSSHVILTSWSVTVSLSSETDKGAFILIDFTKKL